MLKTRYDLPLDTDAASRFLPWITGVMVFLAILAMAAFLLVSGLTRHWRTSLSGTITVQIAAETGDQGTVSLDDRADQAQRALERLSGVTATRVSVEESWKLLEPWLGAGLVMQDLPVPALLDVRVDSGSEATLEDMRRQLEDIPGTSVDDHQAWMKDLMLMARILESVALAVLFLIAGAALLVVMFSARAGLAVHAQVIDLLHVIGATDRYVAGQFQRHAFHMALRGGLGGLAAATVVLLALQFMGRDSEALLLPSFSLAPVQWGILVLVPVAGMILSALTARIVALRALGRMP
ncbi:MAG: hypothetical protein M3O22_06520 [Pseudomonadota bacterium]|nr:hypothetical protein [Pseudomonadota bacterium]